jgi:hypothetical protein
MPIAHMQVTVNITSAVCNFCGRGESISGEPLLAEQHIIDVLRWVALDDGTIACDRCRNLPDVIMRLLYLNKAHIL